MNSIKVSNIELDDYRARNTNKNFVIEAPFKLYELADAWKFLIGVDIKNFNHLKKENREWAKDPHNVVNLKEFCSKLLVPIYSMDKTIQLQCGIVNREIGNLIGVPCYNQLRFGRAAVFSSRNNTFELFQKIISSDLKFSECIYFSSAFKILNAIYIGLETEVLKNIVKVK